MLEILNLLYISTAAALQLTFIPTLDVSPPLLHEVAPTEFRALSYIWSDIFPCRFHGVVIPVERDWEEMIDNGYVSTTLAPEPGKIYAHALLVNKKSCPGKEDEALFVVGSLGSPFLSRGIPKGAHIQFINPERDIATQPKWLPQALTALQIAADKGNKAAQEFVAYSQAEKAVQ